MAINDSTAFTDPTLDPATGQPKQQTQVQPTKAPDYSAASTATPAAPATTPPAGATMPAGMDPNLWKVYQNSGLTPSDQSGTGFADWNYWQNNAGPSQYDRLAADIAGTGSDQPTGTPGSGSWINSGRGATTGPNASMGTLAPGAATGAGTMSGYTALSAAPAFTGTVLEGQPTSADAGDLYKTLMTRAGQSLDVNPNDPVIRDQTNAYEAAQTRAARTAEAQAAERGGPNANIGAETRSASEKAAQNTAGFQASVMQNELTARRAEIAQALQGAQGFLTAQQQMALQEELAKMDVQLKNYQFGESQGQQESQFSRDLAERGFEFDTNDQFRNSPLYGA